MDVNEEFSKAPKEVQEKGIAHNKALHRLRKAETQFELWRQELATAKQFFELTKNDWELALNNTNLNTYEYKNPLIELKNMESE